MQTAKKFVNKQLATVSKIEGGMAKEISMDNQSLPVYSQASHLLHLVVGEEVLYAETNKGIVIIASLLATNHLIMTKQVLQLRHGDSQISLQRNGSITIQNKHAKFHLSSTGDIKSECNTLQQLAKQDIHQCASNNIYLNCNLNKPPPT